MENASYALLIAVGVLIAIIIMSLIVSRWRQIGRFEKTKDEVTAIQNQADFNSEYEAYNKSIMYGTDVLSCLNKAQNNNQKYVYNNYFGNDLMNVGKDDREELFIDVSVKIKDTLFDSFKAYYKNRNGTYSRCTRFDYSESDANYNYPLFNTSSAMSFKDPQVNYYYFENGRLLQQSSKYTQLMWNYTNVRLINVLKTGLGTDIGGGAGRVQTKVKGNTEYHLLVNGDKSSLPADREAASWLAALISTVNLKNQTMINSESPTVFDDRDWWYCEWTTAASDFKSRKFKCTGTEYNETTGYIEKISFEEL